MKRICSQKLAETGNMEEHINCMQEMIDKLAALGEQLKDEMIVAMLLCSLPESYNNLITALESRSEEELTTVFVKGKLIDEYLRRKNLLQASEESSDKALKTQKFKKYPSNKDQRNVDCFFCKKTGHIKKDCRKYGAWKEKQEKVNQVSRNPKGDKEEICFKVRCVQGSNNAWYIDSGATSHMTNNRNFFTIFEPKEENIKTTNGELAKVCGFGSGTLICLTDEDKMKKVTVTDVMYVPDLDSSLLSISKLAKRGFDISFGETYCKVTDNSNIIAIADLSCNLYKLRTVQVALMTSQQHSKNCQHTWHRMLGHRDVNAIKDLTTKELAIGVKIVDCGLRSMCECCIKGKMSRIPFPKMSKNKTQSILELVHTDVCGPMQTATPSNNRYILTIIDDYSRYAEVHLLKEKSDVCIKLTQFITRMETKYNKRLKIIRSDRGGKYTSKELKEFLKAKGIETQYTAAYSPQQNGVAERKNRYLMEMARCMLIDANLPNIYWGEAVITANYLQNRLPTTATGETPYGRWYSRKPDLKNIHIFGSRAYIQVPDQHRRKLNNKAEELLFVGYSEDTKAYRFLNKETNKIKISRDVIFLDDPPPDEEDYRIKGYTEEEERNPDKDNSSESFELMKTPSCDLKKEVTPESPKLRRSERKNKGIPAVRYEVAGKMSEYRISEPETFEEASSGPDSAKWKAAMDEEIRSLQENNTWEIVDSPTGSKTIGCKWIYKLKTDANGTIQRYKARLVAQGYTQRYGIDYSEVFAPVVKQTTFRTLLTIAGKKKMIVKHYDVKNAFLHGKLEKEIYMRQPPGYQTTDKAKVCKLKRGLYGLKQAAMGWNKTLDSILVNAGFARSKTDACLYTHISEGKFTYLIVYVDDILIAGDNPEFISRVQSVLSETLNVTDLGEVNYYLGVQVERDYEGLFYINQSTYIKKVLRLFKLQDCKVSSIPLDVGYEKIKSVGRHLQNNVCYQKLIGALMYMSVFTRPDITASIAILSRKLQKPSQVDWVEAKRVLRYLKGTINHKLKLGNSNEENNELLGYADANWAQDISDRKSNSGYIFKLHGSTIGRAENNRA